MTNPTNPGDISVVGQRRWPGGSFPGGGGKDETTGEVPETEELPDPLEEVMPDPCADSVLAAVWNADAAGAESVDKFLLKAAEIGFADAPNGVPNLLNREFGSFLIRGPGQSVSTGPVTAGPVRDRTDPNWVSTLTIDPTGVTTANYQGDVHSHPNGNPLPSQEDWNSFMINNDQARRSGRTDETFYMYIVVADQNGGSPTIRVYQDGPRAANIPDPARPTTEGPEVNPDAQPCP
ncbi:MAG: hypothetical protein ACI9YM_000103 [Brevundimonas sp.]|uniref:hypothetical protein n=1 Tax=Brevundimonas sp. TaxID=1871086 RepID=UPI0039E61B0C